MLHSLNSDSTLNLLYRWIYEAVKKALVCAVACRLRHPVSLNILDCVKCQINGLSGYLFSFLYFQEGCYSQHISSEEIQKDNINMEGYSKIDPTPKSTATIVIQTNRAWHSSHTLHSRTSTAGSPEARQVQTTSFACLTILSPAKNKSLHQTW